MELRLTGWRVHHKARWPGAVIPAAGISATARDLGRFCQALLQSGELGSARTLNPETIADAPVQPRPCWPAAC